jgi:predicted thioesterase
LRSVSPGQRGHLDRVVTPADTADRFDNVGVQVLATPVICQWFESAAVRAVLAQLEPGEATVGTRIAFEHLAASPVGVEVEVEAEVTEVEGRRIRFKVWARDNRELIAQGTHERFVVELSRFLKRAQAKAVTTR